MLVGVERWDKEFVLEEKGHEHRIDPMLFRFVGARR